VRNNPAVLIYDILELSSGQNANNAQGSGPDDMQEFFSTRVRPTSHAQYLVSRGLQYLTNSLIYYFPKMQIMKRDQATLKRTALLAAFVPDFILNDEGHRIPYQTTLEGVVVIADVSGFTALTEKYSLKGKGGTDQLTKTLSNYMGPLAECILRAGGDIIKYAGKGRVRRGALLTVGIL